MKNIHFTVTQDVLNLGIHVKTAQIKGVQNNKSTPELNQFIEQELNAIKESWSNENFQEDSLIQGFKDLHTKIGRSNRKYIASPEGLLRFFLERGRFPRINSLVDSYNIISLKTRLALGAHNIDKIEGDVILKLTEGNENFTPLGKSEKEEIFPDEYGYIDDGNNIICRMEVLQCEPTKVLENTKDVFMIIQGNSNTTEDYVRSATQEVCELITKYCGGSYILLN